MRSPLSRITLTAGAVLAGAALLAGVAGAVAGASPAGKSKPGDEAPPATWSFGVLADTQWIGADDGKNPNTVAVGLIRQLNQQFIDKHVKFVVQAGDLTDNGSTNALDTTAVFRQDLYNAGIGFYPLRGNHESSAAGGGEFLRVFPQTTTATMNKTPGDAFAPANVDPLQPAPAPPAAGSQFQVGTISATPAAPSGFGGLCYAFDYGNVRVVMLDQFTGVSATSVLTSTQIDWMNSQLAGRPAGSHAFVFGHKGLINENHVDTLFGANPTVSPALQNTFIADLANNGVRYVMGGHDHMHNRAVVKSPDGAASVQDITLQSDSSKFYIPFGTAGYAQRSVNPITKAVTTTGTLASADPLQTNDYIFNALVAGGATRETEIAQELNTIGYYIFTVSGPRVTVDYYSAVVNSTLSSGEYLISATPTMTFTKRETFGYSLNGKELQVPQGASYTSVNDSFDGTQARIISGVNGSTATDSAARKLTKTVDTGWGKSGEDDEVAGSVLTLWGMDDLGAASTDTYTLSMTYGGHSGRDDRPGSGLFRGDEGERGGPAMLVSRDGEGDWVNAVALNAGGHARFVSGPWKSGYGLGTYGVDARTRTAWAVVDHDGAFAVGSHTDH